MTSLRYAATDVRFTVNGMIGTQQGEPTVIGKYPYS